MRRLILILATLAITAPLTFAQVLRTVTITPPTEREDGTQLWLHEIAGYEVECRIEGETDPLTTFTITPPETAGMTDPVFEPGPSFRCRARTADTLGQVSTTWSESELFTVGSPCEEAPSTETCAPPGAPQSIIVSLE